MVIGHSDTRINRWRDFDGVEPTSIMDFKRFCTLKGVREMDLVDQKALYDKIAEKYFFILMDQGTFNFTNLFTVRLTYGFYYNKLKEIVLKTAVILNDICAKHSLKKKSPIKRVKDYQVFNRTFL